MGEPEACRRQGCWGFDVLPKVGHVHLPDRGRPGEDWIRAVEGIQEVAQLELPDVAHE